MKAETARSAGQPNHTAPNPFAAAFAALAPQREQSPDRDLQTEAFAAFERLGIPTVKEEAWRYTNLAPLTKQAFHLATAEGLEVVTLRQAIPFFEESAAARLVFVNGCFQPALSDVSALPGGIEVKPVDATASFAPVEDSPFRALNIAFSREGVLVRIPRGKAVAPPIGLFFVTAPTRGYAMTHPRVLIELDEAAIATVVELHTVLCDEEGRFGEHPYLTNAVTDVHLGQGANLTHIKLQTEGSQAYHVAALRATIGRGAAFSSHAHALGGILSRQDIYATFTDEGGECRLYGLQAIAGRQLADTHIVVDHAVPDCVSEVLYKGVFDGQAHGVFDGRVLVRQGAQRTNAVTTNKNLLLSTTARADTKPQLEIFADDVKCGHGATVGQLNQDELFYLLSRGLTPAEARRLLMFGFAREVSEKLPVPSLKVRLDGALAARVEPSQPPHGGLAQ
ncbi:MAG: Fe-S cluster assembly protein SufD [Chloracidobacterium sp.]|uniref:Fe-S cluster assembly protein SufD n=1 Tax=Chloracidobacterium validum TaxID=2821543 RepID=A0ABX8BC32_9BACT|nr:Fe-S cluster assembly protein SufD [Chloracidobacterium validum]QUW04493.1 Fe-S cluster assembly protein SufD [Chloracidobacterium validum]